MATVDRPLSDAELRDAKAIYDFLSDTPRTEHADFILAAGSHDLRVADQAAALFHASVAPLIVCSGGFGKMTAGTFRKPEAELFAERCMALGVPEAAVLIENCSTNTGENFTLSHRLLDERGIVPKTGVVTCKPYMSKRVWATGTRQWPSVRWYVAPPFCPFEEYPTKDILLERSIQLMVGDLQRCRVYAERGYQAPVDVPEDIWAAMERLAAAGFDEQLI